MLESIPQTNLVQGSDRLFSHVGIRITVYEGEGHIFPRLHSRQEVKRLEDEPYFLVPRAREFVVVHPLNRNAIQGVGAARRLV